MHVSSVEGAASIAERVAVGAIKYAILRQGTGKDTIFDFDRALSLEGDSGPYLEYALARAFSIVRKVPEGGFGEVLTPAEISDVERLLYRFPEVVERAAFEYEPHYVTTYLTTLAGAFNSWYASTRILDAGAASAYRVLLTRAFATTMQNGLNLLAIPVLERM
jgi:arginyl-tRNA synthetase